MPCSAHDVYVDGCFGCKTRSVTISTRVGLIDHQTGFSKRESAPSGGSRNSWERGRVTDERGVPLLDEHGPISVKRYGENRRRFEEERQRLGSHPDPFGVKTP
jgi:hypothetical protein